MRTYTFIGLFLLTVFSSCKEKQEDILASIRTQCADINDNLKDYTYVHADDLISHDHGVISGYYRDNEAKKISTQLFGEKSRMFSDYYFDDGMLIYVVTQEFIYNKPNTYTEEKAREAGDSVWYDDLKTRLEINKYYLHKNKLIKWTGPDNTDVAVNSVEFSRREPVLIANALLAMKQVHPDNN